MCMHACTYTHTHIHTFLPTLPVTYVGGAHTHSRVHTPYFPHCHIATHICRSSHTCTLTCAQTLFPTLPHCHSHMQEFTHMQHTCMHTHLPSHTATRACRRSSHTHAQTHTHTHACTRAHTHIRAHVHTPFFLHSHSHMQFTQTRTHIYTCTHTHTHYSCIHNILYIIMNAGIQNNSQATIYIIRFPNNKKAGM